MGSQNNTGKLLFVVNDSSGNQPLAGYKWGFDLNFSDKITPNRPAFLNLGWILGYRKLKNNVYILLYYNIIYYIIL